MYTSHTSIRRKIFLTSLALHREPHIPVHAITNSHLFLRKTFKITLRMECGDVVRPNKIDVDAEAEAEELEFLRINMLVTPILQMTLMTAMELGVLDILVKGCRDAQPMMTADDVAAQITTHNPEVC